MSSINHLFRYIAYTVWKNIIFRVFLFISLFGAITVRILLKGGTDSESLSVRFFPEDVHVLIIEGVLPSFIPILMFVYLFLCINLSDLLFRSSEVRIILAKKYTKFTLLNLNIAIVSMLSVTFTVLLFIAMVGLFDMSLEKGLGIALCGLAIYLQVIFMRFLKIPGNTILLMYLIFFVFVPLVMQEFLMVVIRTNLSPFLTSIFSFMFDFLSSAINLLGVSPSGFKGFTTILFILSTMYVFSVIQISRKEYS